MHLRQVIEEIETRSPVELIAIGIGHDVTRYYRRAVTITDPAELAGAMTDKLVRAVRGGCTGPAEPHGRPLRAASCTERRLLDTAATLGICRVCVHACAESIAATRARSWILAPVRSCEDARHASARINLTRRTLLGGLAASALVARPWRARAARRRAGGSLCQGRRRSRSGPGRCPISSAASPTPSASAIWSIAAAWC